MSPEQRAGGPATARSDLFSVGVVLREMLTGERALDGGAPAALPSEAHGGLDARHDAVVDRMTALEPALRPADAGEARALLVRWEGRPLDWLAAGERATPRTNRSRPPGAPAPEERVLPRANGGLVDTWTGQALERIALSEGSLAMARAFAAADDAGLQCVLRVDREGEAIWLESLAAVPLDRALSTAERASLRRSLDALHAAGAVHGHVDRAHVVLCEARPVLRFVADHAPTASVDRDRLALAGL